jgi:3-oxoacyl-[acyl-carrier-protein] synthase II
MAFYRKLDNFSQLQVVTGMRALKDAKLSVTEENAKDIGNIVGTSEGALGSTYDFEELIGEKGNAKGSAFKFPNTVYNAAGGYLSICSGLKGYSVTVTSGPVSGLTSIAYSMNVIKEGQEKIMLATGNDENIPILDNLFNELGYKAKSVAAPYSGADGFVLGDASTSLVLEDDANAKERGATVYAHILGYGNGRKNVRFGQLSGTEEALEKAIADALADSGVKADEIDVVYGFANGMKVVDDIEKTVLSKCFGEKPVIAIKERVGEGRAGTATLQVAHASLMLHGDIESDNAYVFSNGSVSRKTVESSGLKKALVISYALGGSYTAVVLGK